MPEETEGNAQAPGEQAQPQANTSDATDKNTGANQGAGTDAAQNQAQPEKTFTQADVDRIVQNRLKSAVKAELKKLTGETEGAATVEDLQRQLSEEKARTRSFEARETVSDYLNDGRNKLNIRPENIRGIQELVIPRLEYDDDGKVLNLKDAIESAKSIAPALFANNTSTINAGAGRTHATPTNMNDFIRQSAGVG